MVNCFNRTHVDVMQKEKNPFVPDVGYSAIQSNASNLSVAELMRGFSVRDALKNKTVLNVISMVEIHKIRIADRFA